MTNHHLPQTAIIDKRTQESPDIFSLRLSFTNSDAHKIFEFKPGQFNMLSLFGIGEIPISIVSDPDDRHFFDHTIRVVGRVTQALSQLKTGAQIGIRGPFGNPWPMSQAKGKDIVLVTGGLGCAPLVAVINYIFNRRDEYGKVYILQGVKHSDDLIWRHQYESWGKEKDVYVGLAADVTSKEWPWSKGFVTELITPLILKPENTIAMTCGPEMMMSAAIKNLLNKNIAGHNIWLSMERNMQCAIGQCGHCQLGPKFVCQDGPVFCYEDIADLMTIKGS